MKNMIFFFGKSEVSCSDEYEHFRKSEGNYEDKWGKLWEKLRKIRGKVRKVMKIDEEKLMKSEESYEDRWRKFEEKWGKLWR